MLDVVASAMRHFGVTLTSATPLAGGLQSVAWRVFASNGCYTARRYAFAEFGEEQVTSELAWLDHLAADDGLSVPRPVRLRSGRPTPYVEYGPGGAPVALWTALTWVEGEPLGRHPAHWEAQLTGETIAAMHARSAGWSPSVVFMRRTYDARLFREAVARLFSSSGGKVGDEDRIAIEAGVTLAGTALNALWADRCRVGVIHADLHDGNLLWSTKRARPGVIDFGRSGFGPFALDLAMAQHYVTPELAEDMLAGYLKLASLTDGERRAMPLLRFLAWAENLAVLSGHPAELEGVVADVPGLADQARSLLA